MAWWKAAEILSLISRHRFTTVPVKAQHFHLLLPIGPKRKALKGIMPEIMVCRPKFTLGILLWINGKESRITITVILIEHKIENGSSLKMVSRVLVVYNSPSLNPGKDLGMAMVKIIKELKPLRASKGRKLLIEMPSSLQLLM